MTIQAFPLKDPNIWFDYDVVYEWLNDLVSPGVCNPNDLLVQSNGTLGVTVKSGRCYVPYLAGDMRCFKLLADSNSGAGNPDWLVNFTAPAAQPRIDRVLALVRDKSRFDTELGKDGKLTVSRGTPTAGANLTNLSGAASVPATNGMLLLANVLVNGATIPAGNIDSTLTAVRPQAKIGLGAVPVGSQRMLAYIERPANQTITVTTEATATEILAAPSFTADGVTPIILDFYTPKFSAGGGDSTFVFTIYEANSAQSLGRIGESTVMWSSPLYLRRRWIPSVGDKEFSIRAFRSNGSATGTVWAGAGGSGTNFPMFLRIVRDD